MSRNTRFWIMAAGAFVICAGVILATAYSVGADPFHPRSRHIWALSLVAAAYAAIRISMIAGRFLDARSQDGEEGTAMPLGPFGKKEHAIDRRMAERKARVEAAQNRAKQNETSTEDKGDE